MGCTLPFEFAQFEVYKFLIEDDNGNLIYKSDPYAHHFETRREQLPSTMIFQDTSGMMPLGLKQRKAPHYEQPVNIYEIHLGSWKRSGRTCILL